MRLISVLILIAQIGLAQAAEKENFMLAGIVRESVGVAVKTLEEKKSGNFIAVLKETANTRNGYKISVSSSFKVNFKGSTEKTGGITTEHSIISIAYTEPNKELIKTGNDKNIIQVDIVAND
jgi:hypothetical protein